MSGSSLGPIWIRSPRSPAHAYWSADSIASACRRAPLLERPAGEYPTTGVLPRQEREPAEPCACCVVAIERVLRRGVAA